MSRVPCRSARWQVCWGVAVSGVLPQVGENRCKVMEKVGFDKIFVCNEEKWQKNAVYLSSVTSCFFTVTLRCSSIITLWVFMPMWVFC